MALVPYRFVISRSRSRVNFPRPSARVSAAASSVRDAPGRSAFSKMSTTNHPGGGLGGKATVRFPSHCRSQQMPMRSQETRSEKWKTTRSIPVESATPSADQIARAAIPPLRRNQ